MINALSKVFSAYQIPNSSFDHMILYLPEFDSYADPTSSTASTGVLPLAEYDRPVLRLAAKAITWTRTPALKPDDLKYELDIDASGRAGRQRYTGTNVMRTSGPLSIDARATSCAPSVARRRSRSARSWLTRLGWTGTATFDVRSPFDRTDSYEIKSQFELTRKLFGDDVSPAAMPTGPRAIVPSDQQLPRRRARGSAAGLLLPAGIVLETMRLKVPEGRRIARLPARSVSLPTGEYQSSYRIDDDTLVVSRKIW